MVEKVLPKFAHDLLDRVIKENGFSDYSVEIKKGSQAGDGFASEIFSIGIIERNKNKRLDVICKVAPFNENHRKQIKSDMIFNHEATFYNKIAPMFAKFQAEKNIPKENQFLTYPKCYATLIDNDNEQYAIILENLRPQGFGMWNRAKTVAIETIRLVMHELGKLHGISIAMKDQKPEEFATLKQTKDFYRDFMQSENIRTMYTASMDRALKSLKNENHKIMLMHLKENVEKMYDDDAPNQFRVLCHGIFIFFLLHWQRFAVKLNKIKYFNLKQFQGIFPTIIFYFDLRTM